jgi:hypothetical protein
MAISTTTAVDPIFVHASPRSGSTYFFNALRRDESLLCFNEAIIDGKHDLARFRHRKRTITRSNTVALWDVNHQFLDREDFEEFIEAWNAVMHLCPKFPAFVEYLPANGSLSPELTTYLNALIGYAQSQGKRPVLCEINSRGRAGALRAAFEGFHIAQYRDPLSQFGSFIRAVIEGGFWGFLAFPATELGTSSAHPLYLIIPEPWRAPELGWHVATRAQHWASDAQYFARVGSSRPEQLAHVFRWHMFSWVLTNLAALSYCDLELDIDKVHDDGSYRASVMDNLSRSLGVLVDFDDIQKFDRYYEFEAFDAFAISDQVTSAVYAAAKDGRLASAIRSLGRQPPTTPLATAIDLLFAKISNSKTSMRNNNARHRVTSAEWKSIAEVNRKIWFNPEIRCVAQHLYPLVAPIARAGRRLGTWYKVRRCSRVITRAGL